MTEITFTIRDSQARAWKQMLGADLGQDSATLNDLVKQAAHRVICDIANREAERAFAETESYGVEGE